MKVDMEEEKATTNTVRFKAVDDDAPISTLYISKEGMVELEDAKKISIEVTVK